MGIFFSAIYCLIVLPRFAPSIPYCPASLVQLIFWSSLQVEALARSEVSSRERLLLLLPCNLEVGVLPLYVWLLHHEFHDSDSRIALYLLNESRFCNSKSVSRCWSSDSIATFTDLSLFPFYFFLCGLVFRSDTPADGVCCKTGQWHACQCLACWI